MEITIKGTPEEVSTLITAMQKRQNESFLSERVTASGFTKGEIFSDEVKVQDTIGGA